MNKMGWAFGVAVCSCLAVSACSSDDDTSSGGAGAAGKKGSAGEAGEPAVGGGSTAGGGGSAGEAGSAGAISNGGSPDEGGAAGTPGATGGNGGTGGGAVTRTCLPAGDLAVSALNTLKYVIDTQQDPDLTFCRGSTYNFVLDASISSHPFYIKTVDNSTGTTNAYTKGVTGNGNTSGEVKFVVPTDAPDTLYYHCSIHAGMGGKITIVD